MKPKELTYEEYAKWRETHTLKGLNADYINNGKKDEQRSTISETLRIARILKENGINLSEIKISKSINGEQRHILLEEIEQDGIDIQKIIEENGLDGKDKFGKRITNLKSACTMDKITEEQKKEVEELGLLRKEKRNYAIKEILQIAKILKSNGVKLGTIQLTKVVNGEQRHILLGEIEQDGIDIQKIIEENGLDDKYELGRKIRYLRTVYSETTECEMTAEEKKQAVNLGLISVMLMEKEKKKQEALKENDEAKGLYNRYKNLLDIIKNIE